MAGDSAFTAVDQKTQDPSALSSGVLRVSENCRIINGTPQTRPGVRAVSSLNEVMYGQIYGEGLFADPNSVRWELLAIATGVWMVADHWQPQFLSLPAGITITGPCELVTAFSVVILFLGPNIAPLYWGGTGSGTTTFGPLPAPLDNTRLPIPNSITAEFVSDRITVPYLKDSVAVSNIGDYTSYQLNYGGYQINQGEADSLVRIMPWINQSVLLFKDHSIYLAQNVSGDLSSMSITQVTDSQGLVGRKAAVLVGNEVFYMDRTGVMKVSQVFEDTPETRALPLSEPILPTIQRINWTYGSGICANWHRERVYFAVPLDQSTTNNALLVWNTANQGWESVDTFADPTFAIDRLVLLDYNGDRRLFAIDFARGMLILLEEGIGSDNLTFSSAGALPINFHIRTRGYAGPGKRNSYRRVGVSLATWNPSYSISVQVDGVGRTYPLVTNKTRSNVKYYQAGKKNWIPTNVNNDWSSPGRQDYHVDTSVPLNLGAGILLNQKQEIWDNYMIDRPGKYCEFDITNSQGAIEVRGVVFEDQEDQRQDRLQA